MTNAYRALQLIQVCQHKQLQQQQALSTQLIDSQEEHSVTMMAEISHNAFLTLNGSLACRAFWLIPGGQQKQLQQQESNKKFSALKLMTPRMAEH